MRDNDRMFTIMSIKCISELGSNCQACSHYIQENNKVKFLLKSFTTILIILFRNSNGWLSI